MIKKTLGGDRLGSGNQMQAALHNYERSTHDLGNTWISSMAPGVLVPFYKKICQNGDTWSIKLKSLIKTLPAIGPCFGTYKLQLDVFEVPIRLYNGILHNNMTKIGMDMSKVKMPKIKLNHTINVGDSYYYDDNAQVAPDSLLKYLGISGIMWGTDDADTYEVERKFNAVPMLGYYDIFKNYYSNKQEEFAYVIGNDLTEEELGELRVCKMWPLFWPAGAQNLGIYVVSDVTIGGNSYHLRTIGSGNYKWDEWLQMQIEWDGAINNAVYMKVVDTSVTPNITGWVPVNGSYYLSGISGDQAEFFKWENTGNTLTWAWNGEDGKTAFLNYLLQEYSFVEIDDNDKWKFTGIAYASEKYRNFTTKLVPFKLDNIDTMRIRILQETALNTEFDVNDENLLPYSVNVDKLADKYSGCCGPMAGLLVKTYQSDIFNCWLSSNWIEGIKGISEISAVAIEDGKFTIDALNLSKKVYNMLNRIAVSGGTYEDWQEAIYGEDALRRAESPIYCGGMSGIIGFEEVVSTADTNTAEAGDQPLGSLGGKGTLVNIKGGNIEVHVKEPSYIIGIASITPYIAYSQGNDFDMTEMDSLNDIHKPELDEIGFQDLMLERAAWFGHYMANTTEVNTAGGKQPAWVEYMTSVNKIYGDFCKPLKCGWMVLNRKYEMGLGTTHNSKLDNGDLIKNTMVKDWTTYIDPTKYNYMFANSKLDAQNFWVQIGIDATCRRKISAKLIPNL